MKDTDVIREEFFFKTLDTMEALFKEAETKGEQKLIHEMLETFSNSYEYREFD